MFYLEYFNRAVRVCVLASLAVVTVSAQSPLLKRCCLVTHHVYRPEPFQQGEKDCLWPGSQRATESNVR